VDDLRETSLVGRTLAHYRISSVIGAGGMGQVYRATDTKLARDIALKVLPSSMASDPDRLARFQREARAVAALNHPNVVTLYSVEESDNVFRQAIGGDQPIERLSLDQFQATITLTSVTPNSVTWRRQNKSLCNRCLHQLTRSESQE
jgi:serine/threonine protein kinase